MWDFSLPRALDCGRVRNFFWREMLSIGCFAIFFSSLPGCCCVVVLWDFSLPRALDCGRVRNFFCREMLSIGCFVNFFFLFPWNTVKFDIVFNSLCAELGIPIVDFRKFEYKIFRFSVDCFEQWVTSVECCCWSESSWLGQIVEVCVWTQHRNHNLLRYQPSMIEMRRK